MTMPDENDITEPFEVEELKHAWAAREAARPRCHAWLSVGAKTDLGRVRENNEDKFDFLEPYEPAVLASRGRVFAVADGMGGYSAGQVAAELALNVFIQTYFADTRSGVEAALQRAVRAANTHVMDVAAAIPGRKGMGATLTAAVVRDDDLYVAQVGDSRCYLLRDGRLEQVTEDHSWVAEQVRSGAMSREDAEQSPFRNVITRSIGGVVSVDADVTAVKMVPGDRFLLCSDGLSGMVDDDEIAALLGSGSPSDAAWKLVERANEQGGRDNITAVILQVLDIQPWPAEEVPAEAQGDNGRRDGGEEHPAEEPVAAAPAAEPSGRGGLMGKIFHRS